MKPRFLEFDYSETPDGVGTFDAMANVAAPHWPTVQQEVAAVLTWAHADWGAPVPLDEGGEWDAEMTATLESAARLQLHYNPQSEALVVHTGDNLPSRYAMTLTLVGSAAFCDAFRERFLPD